MRPLAESVSQLHRLDAGTHTLAMKTPQSDGIVEHDLPRIIEGKRKTGLLWLERLGGASLLWPPSTWRPSPPFHLDQNLAPLAPCFRGSERHPNREPHGPWLTAQ